MMFDHLLRLQQRDDEAGASAVEYGLLVAAIAAVVVAIVFLLGGAMNDSFTGTCDTISTKANTTTQC